MEWSGGSALRVLLGLLCGASAALYSAAVITGAEEPPKDIVRRERPRDSWIPGPPQPEEAAEQEP